MTRPLQRSVVQELVEQQLPGSRLLHVGRLIDWDPIADVLKPFDTAHRGRRGGPTPWPALVVFRALLLQHWFRLSLGEIEYALAYRHDFILFVGLDPGQLGPSSSTLCRARKRWREGGELGVLATCKSLVDVQLNSAGIRIVPTRGALIDVQLIRRRNA